MPLFEAVRLAFAQIRVQKLKSFFTLLGVMIGVMFLIAVVSIVEGMGRYMEEDFAGRLLGANTFTLRRFPWFGNNTTREEWMEWRRRRRTRGRARSKHTRSTATTSSSRSTTSRRAARSRRRNTSWARRSSSSV